MLFKGSEDDYSNPLENHLHSNGKGKEFPGWRWKLGKFQVIQFLLPLSSSDARALLVFISSSLTHKQTKTPQHYPCWLKALDRCFPCCFTACRWSDILIDIFLLSHKWLWSPSALGFFPPFLLFLSPPLPCLSTCWNDKEALKIYVLAVGAWRSSCP